MAVGFPCVSYVFVWDNCMLTSTGASNFRSLVARQENLFEGDTRNVCQQPAHGCGFSSGIQPLFVALVRYT